MILLNQKIIFICVLLGKKSQSWTKQINFIFWLSSNGYNLNLKKIIRFKYGMTKYISVLRYMGRT